MSQSDQVISTSKAAIRSIVLTPFLAVWGAIWYLLICPPLLVFGFLWYQIGACCMCLCDPNNEHTVDPETGDCPAAIHMWIWYKYFPMFSSHFDVEVKWVRAHQPLALPAVVGFCHGYPLYHAVV
jgi:hypothetical protein